MFDFVRCVYLAAGLASLHCFGGHVQAQGDDGVWRDVLRSAAYSNLSRISSLDLRFELTDPSGGVSLNRLVVSGTMARDDRDELRKGSPPPGYPPSNELYSYSSAFNNVRSQLMEPTRKLVTLKDGNQGFFIPWTTPVTFPYSGWLRTDGPARWDKILDEAVWEASFSQARLAGAGNENVVIFPQDDTYDLVVTFNPEAMYLPVQVERIDREKEAVLGRMTVKKWVRLGEPEQSFCVATEIVSESRVNDSEDFSAGFCLKMNDQDVHVNQPVDVSLFTLDVPKDYSVYDVDEVSRYASKIKQINDTAGAGFAPPPNAGSFGYATLWAGALALVLLGAAVFIKWRQHKGT